MKARSLQELGALRRTLQEQAKARALAEQARLQRLAQERAERELFARTVGPVRALPDKGLAHLRVQRPEPRAQQRALDEAAVLREALSDEMDVETLLETDEALSFRRPGISLEVVRKLRRGHWSIQAQVDLHGLRRDEARDRLGHFVRESAKQGWRCVRVIHGKGNGSPGREPVLKGKVRAWLVQKDEVIAFVQAKASDGGHGALIVLLEAH